jgi:hypothetical protein
VRKAVSYIVAIITVILALSTYMLKAQPIIPPLGFPDLPGNWEELKSSTHLSGSLNASMSFYSVSKINNRRPPFVFNIYGNPSFRINDIVVPLRFSVGSYQNKYRQEFNRFGLSPTYKWLKLHLGHSMVNFSPLALSNRNFLGAGIELTPGKIRFGLVYGRFQRKIDFDSANLIANNAMPAYKRLGFGMKIGYGNERNHLDLVVFKAKDRYKSLKVANEISRPSPEENAVVALSAKVNFLKNFFVDFDLGLSAYSLNTNAPESSLSGFVPARIPALFLNANSSTQYLSAIKARISYKLKTFDVKFPKTAYKISDLGLSLNYDRISPSYKSMGTYLFRNDVERIRFMARFRMLDRKLGISFPIGFEHNDLLNTKFINNKRFIVGLNANYRYSNDLYLNFVFSNFRNKLTREINPSNDTLLINQVNRNTSLGGVYSIGAGSNKKRITARLGYQSGKNISGIVKTRSLSKFYMNGSYRFAYPLYDLMLTTGLGLSVFKFTAFKTTRIIPSVNISRNFLNKKIKAIYNLGFVMTWANSAFANFGLRNNLRLNYVLSKKQSISIRLYYLQNLAKGFTMAEAQVELRYAIKL